jgi:hypothetical protein
VVLLAGFFKDVLWCDEAVRHKSPEPMGDVYDVIVLLFLVHGGHDLVDFGADGGVVPFPPV